MPISRVTAGFVMIGVSIFLLLYVGLRNDLDPAIGIAWGSFVENFIAVIALALIGFGIQFAFFSKPCPVCDEKLRRTATDCYQCGFNFQSAPRRMSRGSHQSYWLPKAKKYETRLRNLVVNSFRLSLGFSIIILIITSLLLVAVWMRVTGHRNAGYVKTKSSDAVTEPGKSRSTSAGQHEI